MCKILVLWQDTVPLKFFDRQCLGVSRTHRLMLLWWLLLLFITPFALHKQEINFHFRLEKFNNFVGLHLREKKIICY